MTATTCGLHRHRPLLRRSLLDGRQAATFSVGGRIVAAELVKSRFAPQAPVNRMMVDAVEAQRRPLLPHRTTGATSGSGIRRSGVDTGGLAAVRAPTYPAPGGRYQAAVRDGHHGEHPSRSVCRRLRRVVPRCRRNHDQPRDNMASVGARLAQLTFAPDAFGRRRLAARGHTGIGQDGRPKQD